MKWFNEIRRALSPTYWLVAAVALVVVLALIVWLFGMPGRAHRDAVEAKAGASLAGARTESAKDAIDAVTDNAERQAEIDARVKGSEHAIRQAAPGERDLATLRELCRSPSNARRAECRQQ